MDKLTGADYMNRPLVELQSHPDFSPHAYRIVDAISKMKTAELEKIDLIGVCT